MTLGAKHPRALGRPAHDVWAEIWPDIGPRIQRVLDTGEATWDEGLLLILERSGYPEETYHTFSYSPLADDTGAVAGMLCLVTEETDRLIGERRLRDLAVALGGAASAEDVCREAARVLADDAADFPFALVTVEGTTALALADGGCSDLVLLDIHLGADSGLDVLPRMRERDHLRRVPIVVLTGYALPGDHERFLAAGFDGYFSKPFDPDALLTRVGQVTRL